MNNKPLLLCLLFFLTAFSMQAQYRTLEKELIRKKTNDYVNSNDQVSLSKFFTVYKVFVNNTSTTLLTNTTKQELLNRFEIVDIIPGANAYEFYIYSKYKTEPTSIKDILYSLNFKLDDYKISYATNLK